MRTVLGILLCLIMVSPAEGQLFRRRGYVQPYCPGPGCGPMTPGNLPGVTPVVEPGPAPEPKELAELEKIIPPEIRVRNIGGNCGWCALEDVFVAAGYQEFRGLMQRALSKGWGGTTISDIEAQLKQAQVEYILTENRDYSIFDHAKAEGVGVYIQIPGHALACVGLDRDYAYIVDNNPPLTVQRWTRQHFENSWRGVACCPRKKRHPKPLPTVQPQPQPAPKEQPKPPEPSPPVGCKCPPAEKIDLSPLTNGLAKLTDVSLKTNESVVKLSAAVNSLDVRMGQTETRIAVLEQRPTEVPAAEKQRLDQVAADLKQLRESLKASGTLRITVTPK